MSGFGQGTGSGFSFGTQNAAPFGQPQPQQPPSSIPFGNPGLSNNPNVQSSGGFGFGSSATQPGAVPSGNATTTFGASAPFGQPSAAAMTFGSSPNVVTSSSTFVQSSNVDDGRGFAPANRGFGAGVSSQTTTGFKSGFGNHPFSSGAIMEGGTGGDNAGLNNPFGTSKVTSDQSAAKNPFATETAGSGTGTVHFGTSSNVVKPKAGPTNSGSTDWGTSAVSSGVGSNPFGGPTSGLPNSNDDGALQQMQDNEGHAGGSPNPFFQPNRSRSPAVPNQPRPLSPIYESQADSAGKNPFSSQPTSEEVRLKAKMEEKKRLQAKIEEKKRRLLERKQRKTQGKEAPLNANASAFVPSSPKSPKPAPRTVAPGDQPQTFHALPADLRAKSGMEKANVGAAPVAEKEREDLENAVSLVGTCTYMCPDDELLRRQRESDIQQLEIPLPGTLHPPGWTLRDTAIKRFRRSAADYKLDVPEWVRPPDVLEQVCGYLEEWVMDRDRQGPDPRFPQGGSPPPLDIYQFIWDRTRMIRKDFTLQNYVGTGGKCDARAVRCHERIARWHCMCEHQLSHIPDFVVMQSQQNIQELGQTMKTLNQFYDDSLNRSTVEVPDEQGKETRLDRSAYSFGCRRDSVQGTNPVDYNGAPMRNSDSGPLVQRRLFGASQKLRQSHGTAESEIRGLYILLTLNNDGGMEVLKYVAKLFKERPQMYRSRPVQLAISIYKAKKEYNYARFFAILKSPATPYLFGCIMFKYVEPMRKIAMRIMSKTFGARKKDTGETIYDAYPLSRLVDLLCFEDADEARAACKHYNITVKEVTMSGSSNSAGGVIEVIFWRQSDFKEPKHPEKGHVLPLRPRKMNKTIESKLQGATRLGVCRGEVSGEGSSLAAPTPASALPPNAVETQKVIRDQTEGRSGFPTVAMDQVENGQVLDEEALVARQKQEFERIQREQKRLEEEKKRQEAERSKRELLEKERKDRERALQLKQQQEEIQRENERRRKQKEAEEKERIRELERLRREKEKQEEEERRKAQLAREQKEREERERLEAERLERIRQQRLAAEERKRRQEEERRQKEIEAKRQEMLRKQREAKQREEAERRRKEKLWQTRADSARLVLLIKRWHRRSLRRLAMVDGGAESLRRIDSSFSKPSRLSEEFEHCLAETEIGVRPRPTPRSNDTRRLLEQLIRHGSDEMSLSDMALRDMESPQGWSDQQPRNSYASKNTMLMKVGVHIVPTGPASVDGLFDLVHHWIDSRLRFNKVFISHRTLAQSHTFEIRSVAVPATSRNSLEDCDVALFVIPAHALADKSTNAGLSLLASDGEMPIVVLVLGDVPVPEDFRKLGDTLALMFGGNGEKLQVVCTSCLSPEAFDRALASACKRIVRLGIDGCIRMSRTPAIQLAAMTVLASLWGNPDSAMSPDSMLDAARACLQALAGEAVRQSDMNEDIWCTWPPPEFVTDGTVQGFFSESDSLPANWRHSLRTQAIQSAVESLLNKLTGSIRDVVKRLVAEAPQEVREECSSLVAQQRFRRCLETATVWSSTENRTTQEDAFLYLPEGMSSLIAERTVENVNRTCGYFSESPGWLERVQPQSGVQNLGGVQATAAFQEVRGKSGLEATPSRNSTATRNNRAGRGKEGSNKRRRPSACNVNHEKDSGSDTKGKRTRASLSSDLSKDLEESRAFSKRLEGLLKEGENEQHSDESLNVLLQTVPRLNFDIQ